MLHLICLVNVEDCVFPVSVRLVRRGTESNLSLNVIEEAVEPGDNAARCGVLLNVQLISCRKIDVLFLHVHEIEVDDLASVRHNHLELCLILTRIEVVDAWLFEDHICHD